MPWVDENLLDDPDALRALDTRDSLRSLASAGAQVRRALVSAEEAGVARVSGGERPARCSSPPWVAPPWSATCSTCSPSPGRPSRS